jgi:hypothetical protein
MGRGHLSNKNAPVMYYCIVDAPGSGTEGAAGGVQGGELPEAVLRHPHPAGLPPLPHHQHGQTLRL